MTHLKPLESITDIPQEYRDTSIARLIEYHNFGREFENYTATELFIGMCMDYRKMLRVPDNFAYIIRAGGANLKYSEFIISYAVGVGGVKYIAVIGHTQCGMSHLDDRREIFIKGMVERAGWLPEQASEHFAHFSSLFEIGEVEDFILAEANRLNLRYPKIIVVPFIYRVEDSKLYLLQP